MSSSPSTPLYCVVMAGGAGTRFWPLSRRSRPKQLLNFGGERSLLATTVDRMLPLIGPERLLVVTSGDVADRVREELEQLPAANVLVEPAGRDTAACVGWMAWKLAATAPGAIMVVVPADHVIPDGAKLRLALAAAAAIAHARGGLVTLALRPTRPETGYGYLELGESVGETGGFPVHPVLRFTEKPAREEAERMVQAGCFRWNAGMFAWRAETIRDEIRRHLPELAAGLDAMLDDCELLGEQAAVARHYPSLPKTSIDFGVMEKTDRVWAVSVELAWSDVGSWLGLEEIADTASGGVRLGDVLALDSEGSVLVSDGPLIAAVSVPGVVVVATRDAVLVLPKEHAQRVKDVVERLRAAGRDDLL